MFGIWGERKLSRQGNPTGKGAKGRAARGGRGEPSAEAGTPLKVGAHCLWGGRREPLWSGGKWGVTGAL